MAKPQGRPPVKDKDRRDRRVPFVVTKAESEEIWKAATADGETISTWVRKTVLKAARRRVQ